jgi:hypothetical protein
VASLGALMLMVTRGLFEQRLAVGFGLWHRNGFGEAHMLAGKVGGGLLACYAALSGLVRDGVVHCAGGE